MSMKAIITRDLRLFALRGSEAVTTVFFFVIVASLFPFAFTHEAGLLQKAAAGIIWVAALLAALMSLENIYTRDAEDGTMDMLLMSPVAPACIALAKMASHWLLTGAPLVMASLLVSVMLGVPGAKVWILSISLVAGTFYMSLLGGIGAALTLGARRPGVLLAVIVLPLFIPMLILGTMAAEAALANLPFRSYLLLQLAMVIALLPVAPAVAAAFFNMHLRST